MCLQLCLLPFSLLPSPCLTQDCDLSWSSFLWPLTLSLQLFQGQPVAGSTLLHPSAPTTELFQAHTHAPAIRHQCKAPPLRPCVQALGHPGLLPLQLLVPPPFSALCFQPAWGCAAFQPVFPDSHLTLFSARLQVTNHGPVCLFPLSPSQLPFSDC